MAWPISARFARYLLACILSLSSLAVFSAISTWRLHRRHVGSWARILEQFSEPEAGAAGAPAVISDQPHGQAMTAAVQIALHAENGVENHVQALQADAAGAETFCNRLDGILRSTSASQASVDNQTFVALLKALGLPQHPLTALLIAGHT